MSGKKVCRDFFFPVFGNPIDDCGSLCGIGHCFYAASQHDKVVFAHIWSEALDLYADPIVSLDQFLLSAIVGKVKIDGIIYVDILERRYIRVLGCFERNPAKHLLSDQALDFLFVHSWQFENRQDSHALLCD